jgi:hypothetical protein
LTRTSSSYLINKRQPYLIIEAHDNPMIAGLRRSPTATEILSNVKRARIQTTTQLGEPPAKSAKPAGTPAFPNTSKIFLILFSVCDHLKKGTRFEKRKRVCRRVEIQCGTGGF